MTDKRVKKTVMKTKNCHNEDDKDTECDKQHRDKIDDEEDKGRQRRCRKEDQSKDDQKEWADNEEA